MFVFDTNVLVYAANRDSKLHGAFIAGLLDSTGFQMLVAGPRHGAVLAETLSELPHLRGSVMHDLHIAVLMREHGLSRICTRDSDFRRFPFLTVVDPAGPASW